MSHYNLIAHQIGSAEALELGRHLAAWHDRMVTHQRGLATSAARACEEGCPHEEAVELWQAARDAFGDAADRLTFLKTIAEEAATSGSGADARRPTLVAAARR